MPLPIIDQIANNVAQTLAAPLSYDVDITGSGTSLDTDWSSINRVSFVNWHGGGPTRYADISLSGGNWVLTITDTSFDELIVFRVTANGNIAPPLTGWVFDAGASNVAAATISSFIKTTNFAYYAPTVVDDLKTAQPVSDALAQVSYDDPQPEDEAPLGHEQFLATFHVVVTLAISTVIDTPLTEKAYIIESEIIRELMVDYTRGVLAVDTIPLAASMGTIGEGGGSWAVVSVNFNVRFRTLYGDRFNQ